MTTPEANGTRGLLLDYGGVLTTNVAESFLAWEREHGLQRGELLRLIRSAYADADGGLIGRLERGEIGTEEFDEAVARLLAERGHRVPDDALVDGMFAGMLPAGGMWEVAERARRAGVRLGLLSNSWGTSTYPRERLDALFDVQVISGEVGMRKPDPAIYELAAERLGVVPGACAFVDALRRNVEVAESLGMYGVVHEGDAKATERRLAEFLPLQPGGVDA